MWFKCKSVLIWYVLHQRSVSRYQARLCCGLWFSARFVLKALHILSSSKVGAMKSFPCLSFHLISFFVLKIFYSRHLPGFISLCETGDCWVMVSAWAHTTERRIQGEELQILQHQFFFMLVPSKALCPYLTWLSLLGGYRLQEYPSNLNGYFLLSLALFLDLLNSSPFSIHCLLKKKKAFCWLEMTLQSSLRNSGSSHSQRIVLTTFQLWCIVFSW